MTVNELVKLVHANAVDKGFWDEHKVHRDGPISDYPSTYTIRLNPAEKLSKHMLMVSEIAEASESVRKGEKPFYLDINTDKWEGEAVEIADCVIRAFDYAGAMGWDLEKIILAKHEYNTTRPYKHGKKL